MNDVLMVYYSFEGNTGFVAELVKKYCSNITIEQLIVEKEPPKNGLGKFLLGGKSAIFKEDPHLQDLNTSVDDYKKIIIGFPVWAGTFPPAIAAYLNSVKINGRDVYVIACSMSGNANKAIANIQEKLGDSVCKGTLSLTNPLKNKESTEEKIVDFLKGNNII